MAQIKQGFNHTMTSNTTEASNKTQDMFDELIQLIRSEQILVKKGVEILVQITNEKTEIKLDFESLM